MAKLILRRVLIEYKVTPFRDKGTRDFYGLRRQRCRRFMKNNGAGQWGTDAGYCLDRADDHSPNAAHLATVGKQQLRRDGTPLPPLSINVINSGDSIHPSPEGYMQVTEEVWRMLFAGFQSNNRRR